MIRIFVGCAEDGLDAEAQAALEWSIRKHTAREVSITWMNDWRGWNRDRWTTPFSAGRWQVPAMCEFAGKAIYCDSDFLFLADIGELWDQDIAPGKIVIAKGPEHPQRLCCCVWDCAAAKPHMPSLAELRRDAGVHRRMMQYMAAHQELVQKFSGGNWNCLDLEPVNLSDPRTKAVHFTGIPTQPHLKYALPRLAREGKRHWYQGQRREHPKAELQALFDQYLAEAVAAGYTLEQYRAKDVEQGDVDEQRHDRATQEVRR